MLEFGEVIAWIYIIFITFFLLFLIYECFRKPSEKPPETAKQEVVHKLYLSECVTRCYEFLDFLSGLGRIELDWALGPRVSENNAVGFKSLFSFVNKMCTVFVSF